MDTSLTSPSLDIPQILAERQEAISKAFRSASLDPSLATSLRQSVRLLSPTPCLLSMACDSHEDPIVDDTKMSVTLPISTMGKDRMGDVVMPRGCIPHLKNYQRNPRVFFSHRSSDHPIGSARNPDTGELALSVQDDKIVSTCYFHGETAESDVIFRLVKRKELQAASIGFLPVLAALLKQGEDEAPEKTPDGERLISIKPFIPLRFLEWDLTEWSIVPIPANPEACESLTVLLEKGHVEGCRIPQSISKSLEPFKLKAKIWSPGFNPESTKYTGILALGEREVEYSEGKLIRLDQHKLHKDEDEDERPEEATPAQEEQQTAPVVTILPVVAEAPTAQAKTFTHDELACLIEQVVQKTLSTLDDTSGGALVSSGGKKECNPQESQEHEKEEMKLMEEIRDLLKEHVEASNREHKEILACLAALEGKKAKEEDAKSLAASQALREAIIQLTKTNAEANKRLERITGRRS